jgi:hypothetical protein
VSGLSPSSNIAAPVITTPLPAPSKAAPRGHAPGASAQCRGPPSQNWLQRHIDAVAIYLEPRESAAAPQASSGRPSQDRVECVGQSTSSFKSFTTRAAP